MVHRWLAEQSANTAGAGLQKAPPQVVFHSAGIIALIDHDDKVSKLLVDLKNARQLVIYYLHIAKII